MNKKQHHNIFAIILLVFAVLTPTVNSFYAQDEVLSDRINIYFPREGDRAERVLTMLFDQVPAGGYVYAAIYSLTHPLIVKSMVNAQKRGVAVYVITDRKESQNPKQRSALNTLRTVGIPVKQNSYSGLMHVKMAVINNQYLAFGSFNWTISASDYSEELLAIMPVQVDTAAFIKCKESFEQMWSDNANYN